MTLTPRLRKLALTAHVTASVGWMGAVAAFLALAITGLSGGEKQALSSPYPAMDVLFRFVIVPLGVASLLTGLLQSFGTKWGLFRHYWVVMKLAINVFATIILLLYMENVSYLADVAPGADLANGDFRELRVQAVIHSGAALVLLLAATVLSVFKPRGVTRYGRRRLSGRRAVSQA